MDIREYIVSERFIHDDLVGRAAAVNKTAIDQWQKDKKLGRAILSWPGETIKDDKGVQIKDLVYCQVPDSMDMKKALVAVVERTKAYGVVVVEMVGEEIKVLLETHHGTVCWRTPLERHGDVAVPGKTKTSENSEAFGVLWSPNQGRS